MARALNKLSTLGVANAKKPGLHSDGGGLYLSISRSGSKSWIFRYRRRDIGLGSYPAISLSAARLAATEARELLARGGDPLETRRRSGITPGKAMTFRQCAIAHIEAKEKGWKSKRTAKRWEACLERYAFPVIGHLPIDAVETWHVEDILEPIWSQRTETASMVRTYIEAILNRATAREQRSGANPARWRGHMEDILPKRGDVHTRRHQPSLPYEELPAFMVELRKDGSFGARALEFQILTAARPSEAREAVWPEIGADIWTVPIPRMKKTKKRRELPHRVPLSGAAIALLADLPRLSRYLLPGRVAGKPYADTVFREVLKRMGRNDVTAHGFRTRFRTWAAERTSFPRELCEIALSHAIGETERAYMRSDLFEKRRALMDAWGAYCTRPVGENVVSNQQGGDSIIFNRLWKRTFSILETIGVRWL
jgi:integrase